MNDIVWISGGYHTVFEKQPDGSWLVTRRHVRNAAKVVRAEGKDPEQANLNLKRKLKGS